MWVSVNGEIAALRWPNSHFNKAPAPHPRQQNRARQALSSVHRILVLFLSLVGIHLVICHLSLPINSHLLWSWTSLHPMPSVDAKHSASRDVGLALAHELSTVEFLLWSNGRVVTSLTPLNCEIERFAVI